MRTQEAALTKSETKDNVRTRVRHNTRKYQRKEISKVGIREETKGGNEGKKRRKGKKENGGKGVGVERSNKRFATPNQKAIFISSIS